MRTTVDLPDDLHRVVGSLALHTRRSLSQTVADLIRRGLSAPAAGTEGASQFVLDPATQLPVLRTSRTITPEDVSALDDDA
jgi:hypothetical protein